MSLKLRTFAFGAIGAMALATFAHAQSQATHGSGGMAMSANGQLIAFTVLGLPANQFILFDTANRRPIIIETPGPHVGEFGWSPDGDELTFVTAERHALAGEGSHIWRLRPTAAGPVVDLLALIPYVRSPVLSVDGKRLAAFEGVVAGGGQGNALNMAHAIFEHTVPDGLATRRSEGHALLGGRLRYDRQGALYIRLTMPVFPQAHNYSGRVVYNWVSRDAANRWDYQWRADINDAFYFRLAPGETLPAWPLPFPVTGAPRGAYLVRPLDDGRIAMYATNSPSSTLDWYDERGRARPRPRDGPIPYNYVAYAKDGTAEILVRTPLPEGAGRSGGADLSSDGVLFAQVITRFAEGADHTLMVFERGALAFELPVAELVAHAPRIVAAPSAAPLVPAVSEPHRLVVDPPP